MDSQNGSGLPISPQPDPALGRDQAEDVALMVSLLNNAVIEMLKVGVDRQRLVELVEQELDEELDKPMRTILGPEHLIGYRTLLQDLVESILTVARLTHFYKKPL